MEPASGHSGTLWLVVVWGMAVVAGAVLLWSYKLSPGPVGRVPGAWPAASRLPRTAGRPIVVLFAHPRCPCTRASLAELAALAEELGPEVDVVVAAARFAGVAETPELAALVAAVPRALLIADPERSEAARFGAHTSGQVVVYGRGDQLLFSGGITDARGHAGASAGRARIRQLLAGQVASAEAPVFGCNLSSADARP